MKISADAWSKFTGYNHNVVDGRPISISYKDKTVEVRVETKSVSMTGHYDMRIQLNFEEIQEAYFALLQGPILEKLDSIRKEE